MSFNLEDAIECSKSGDISATRSLVEYYFNKYDYMEALKYALEGLESDNDLFCHEMAGRCAAAYSFFLINSFGTEQCGLAVDILNHVYLISATCSEALHRDVNLQVFYEEFVRAYFYQGVADDNPSKYERAIKYYRMCTGNIPSDITYCYIGCLLNLQCTDESLEIQEKLIKEHDNTLTDEMLINLCSTVASIHLGKGNLGVAKIFVNKIREINPDDEFVSLFDKLETDMLGQ